MSYQGKIYILCKYLANFLLTYVDLQTTNAKFQIITDYSEIYEKPVFTQVA